MGNLKSSSLILKELSKEEVSIAPSWAELFIADDNDVLFLSGDKSRGQWLTECTDLESGFDLEDEFDVTSETLDLLDEAFKINR